MALGIDRVRREIEAECIAFRGHPLGQCPAYVAGQTDRRNTAVGPAAEQAMLATGPLFVGRGGVRKDGLSRGVDRWPVRVQRIERPAAARLSS